MVKGHHLQLRCHPHLFHNFKQFNIKAATAHHPVIQKEVDELLDKSAIEPSTSSSCLFTQQYLLFLSALVLCFMAHMQILSDLITLCTCLLIRCLLLDRYSNLLNKVMMLFLLISRMLITSSYC